MKSILRVNLLGGFQLLWQETPLDTVHSPRLQSLLAYLILHRDTPQSRRHLAFTFFPDSSEAQARTNLRNLIHLLHHALPDAERFLDGDALVLRWRPDAPFTLDVTCFEKALREAVTRKDWQAAVDLYRGDLLPDCYDDWILPERERLRQHYVDALEGLVARCEQAQDYLAARRYAQRLLRFDPLREESYRRLMQLSALSGDRAGVVHFYKTCVTVLQRELAVEPGAATVAAYQEYLRYLAQPPSPDQTPRLGKRLDNLPLLLTRLIGRDPDVRQVQALVAAHRLVTLVGSAGVGKTRLGLAVAQELRERFSDGVWFIDLAPLSGGELLPQAIASVLGVHERPGAVLLDAIADFLRAKRILLVLDNCEHLVPATIPLTKSLLNLAPELKILATSRQAMGFAGEVVWRVQPLSVPDVPEGSVARSGSDFLSALAQSASVELFVDRAVAALPTFRLGGENARAVTQICQRLDGIPLAIELAAARVKLLSAEEIAERADNALEFITNGDRTATRHHQTLRAAIAQSHESLSEEERLLLRRLSVFAGGFTLDAVEQVCADPDLPSSTPRIAPPGVLDLLSNLIDKSLVTSEPRAQGVRTRLLEPIREFASEQLSGSGETQSVRQRYLDYYLKLAEQPGRHLDEQERNAWLSRLETEHGNLRNALEWSKVQPDGGDLGLRLASALVPFWERHSYLTGGQHWLEEMLEICRTPSPARANALTGLGTLSYMQGYYSKAAECHARALSLFRQFENNRGIILATENLAIQAYRQQEYERAESLFRTSLALARQEQDQEGIERALDGLGILALAQGDLDRAKALLVQGLAVARELHDQREIISFLINLGEASMLEGDFESAARWYRDSLKIADEIQDPWFSASILTWLGVATRLQGKLEEASTYIQAALARSVDINSTIGAILALEALAGVVQAQGNPLRAARLFGAAEALRESICAPMEELDRPEYERTVAAARSQLDDKAFVGAWGQGRTMSQVEAIACAMQED